VVQVYRSILMVLEIRTPVDEDSVIALDSVTYRRVRFAICSFLIFWKCRKPRAIPPAVVRA